MPLSSSGRKVMASMKKSYGKRGKNVFYATMNKEGMKGKWEGPKPKAMCEMHCTPMENCGEPSNKKFKR